MCEGYVDMQECAVPRSAPPSLAPSFLSPAPPVTGQGGGGVHSCISKEERCLRGRACSRDSSTGGGQGDVGVHANIREEQMRLGKVCLLVVECARRRHILVLRTEEWGAR
jgi:hypothetical protein